jgi:hypothetical protein
MSIQAVPTFELPRLPDQFATPPGIGGITTWDITNLSGSISHICQMPETGIIDSIFFRIDDVNLAGAWRGGAPSLEVALETVSFSTGVPTGFLINSSASAVTAPLIHTPTTPTNYELNFEGAFQISRGQIFAIVFSIYQINSYPFGSAMLSGTGIQVAQFEDDNSSSGFPYTVDNGAPPTAASSRDGLAPILGIGLAGVSAMPLQHCWPFSITPPTFTFTAPAIHGNKITINGAVRACGAAIWGQVTTVSSRIILYDTNGVDILASTSWQPNLPNSTTLYKASILFDNTVVLDPGTYYIAVSGGTGTTSMANARFSSSFWRGASPFGGTNVVYVSSNTSSSTPAWVEENTRQAFLSLLVDGIDDGAARAGETSCVFAT